MEKKRRLRNGEFTLSPSFSDGGGGDGSGDGTKVGPFPLLLRWLPRAGRNCGREVAGLVISRLRRQPRFIFYGLLFSHSLS